MSKDTSISWCDSSTNAMMGCAGCELWNPKKGIFKCYAGVMTRQYGNRKGWPASFEEPALFPERIAEALKWKDLTGQDRAEKPWLNGLPRLIFLNDMGDTFTKGLPVDWLAPHLPAMADSPHQWLILTKSPSRMLEFNQLHSFPPNVWPGVSVTTMATAKRIDYLKHVKGGGPKFISLEPMYGRVRVGINPDAEQTPGMDRISWLILGVESDGDRVGELSLDGSITTEDDWNAAAEEVVDGCDAAGTRVFVKQIPRDGKVLHDANQFPTKLQRREYP